MSISDRDVFATAKLLIRQHNGSAAYYASGRADELLDAGDIEGASVWRRVAKAAEELLAMEPPDGTKHRGLAHEKTRGGTRAVVLRGNARQS